MVRRVVTAALAALALLVLAVAAVILVVVNPTSARSTGVGVDPDPERLRELVERLAALEPARSWEHPGSLNAAADLIAAELTAAGVAVREQTWEVEGETYRNLVAAVGPDTGPVLVLGAHYDVCGDQPGADDNASGVAVLVELARLLTSAQPTLAKRVELVAYSLEEPPFFRTPHMGSAVHAAALRRAGTEVEAMLSLEMLGYFSDEPGSQAFPLAAMGLVYPTTGDFITVVGDLGGRRLVRRVKGLMAGASELPVWSINAPAAIPGIDFSDHGNYWLEGYPAVMITDTAFYRNRRYHEPADTPDTLDYGRMAEVTRGLFAVIVGLAG